MSTSQQFLDTIEKFVAIKSITADSKEFQTAIIILNETEGERSRLEFWQPQKLKFTKKFSKVPSLNPRITFVYEANGLELFRSYELIEGNYLLQFSGPMQRPSSPTWEVHKIEIAGLLEEPKEGIAEMLTQIEQSNTVLNNLREFSLADEATLQIELFDYVNGIYSQLVQSK